MDADKHILVVNIPLLNFVGGITNQRRTGKIKGYWNPDRLLALVMEFGVPLEEAFSDTVINANRAVINL